MNLAAMKIKFHAEGVRKDKCHLGELYSKYDWSLPCFFLQDVPVIVRHGKWAELSPFEIREVNGGYAIFRDGEFFVDVFIPPKPRFLERKNSDGVPMYKIGELIFTGNFSLLVNQQCLFWKTGKQCCFCTVGNQGFLKTKTPEQIVEVVQAGLDEGVIKRVTMMTGYRPGADVGITAVSEAVKAVKERFDIPICADISPPRDERYLELLADAGVDSLEINIECFDFHVRARVLPGKSRMSIERYTRAWKKGVDLLGENRIVSIIMAGLGESNSSIFEGAEYIANLGVIPYLTPVHPASGSRIDGQSPPSAQRMTKLYREVAEIIKKYGLNPFKVRAGMIPSGGESALKEVMRFGI